MDTNEQVLVFCECCLEFLPCLPGYLTGEEIYTEFASNCMANSVFINRQHAEVTPAWKQVIPYTMIQATDGTVLCYKRSKTGGEGRLYDKWSVGIGGHINPCDAANGTSISDILTENVSREMNEELILSGIGDSVFDVLGILYNDSTPVNSVHIGVVCSLTVDAAVKNTIVPSSEGSITEILWLELQDAITLIGLEDWSKIVLSKEIEEDLEIWRNK